MGFTVQSMLKRIPMVISPLLGGALIGALGIKFGIRVGLLITLAFAGITFPVLLAINLPIPSRDTVKMHGVWQSISPILKRLLLSDIVIRTCEGMADIFFRLASFCVCDWGLAGDRRALSQSNDCGSGRASIAGTYCGALLPDPQLLHHARVSHRRLVVANSPAGSFRHCRNHWDHRNVSFFSYGSRAIHGLRRASPSSV